MENHDNEMAEVEVDSLTEEDETLTAPAVEPTAEEQAEHDASFGSEDSDSVELIEDANSEPEAVEAPAEEVVEEVPVADSQTDFNSLVEAVAEKVLSLWRSNYASAGAIPSLGAQNEAEVGVQDKTNATDKQEEKEEEDNKEEKEELTEDQIDLRTILFKDTSLDESLSAEEAEMKKKKLKDSAATALERAKQYASPALYRKIKDCVCKKSDNEDWGLSACNSDSEWSPELKQEAIEKEALIMGWENNSSEELKSDYTNALLVIEDLEKQLSEALNYLNSKVNKEISLQKEDPELADMVKWLSLIHI